MAIITISRGSHSKGTEVAEQVAARLGYECIGREVLLQASESYNVPEALLVRAMNDSPGFLDRFTHGKERYVAYIQAAVLKALVRDDVVYHGLAGHFFVRDIAHALKVRILADMTVRVAAVVERDRLSEREAAALIARNDEERRKWSRHLYGIDTSDPSLYDLTVHIGRLSVADAVDLICNTARAPSFRTTPESQQAIEDLALVAQVRAALVGELGDVEVTGSRGSVRIRVRERMLQMETAVHRVESLARAVEGVREVQVDADFV